MASNTWQSINWKDPFLLEQQQMADIVEKAMKDGAVGFSTNRYEPHKAPDGRAIPGTYAESSELVEIAKVVGPRDGLMQLVGADAEIMRSIAETEGSRVLLAMVVQVKRVLGLRLQRILTK